MMKFIKYLLMGTFLFLNLSIVKAEVIDDLVKKLPNELTRCYEIIYNKEASGEKINYEVSLDNDMLYIIEKKDGKTLFIDGFYITDNVIDYEAIYNLDNDNKEIENKNKVNYLAIYNLVTILNGYTENYNFQILDILTSGDFDQNGYTITTEEQDKNIKEAFKINLDNFIVAEELEAANKKESTKGIRYTGYIVSTIIVICGLGILIFLNRDVIFGGKFFK